MTVQDLGPVGTATRSRKTIEIVIGEPMYAEGTGPRAIVALNERAQAWNEATQRAMGALPPVPENAEQNIA